jgi:hypothetical protein
MDSFAESTRIVARMEGMRLFVLRFTKRDGDTLVVGQHAIACYTEAEAIARALALVTLADDLIVEAVLCDDGNPARVIQTLKERSVRR